MTGCRFRGLARRSYPMRALRILNGALNFHVQGETKENALLAHFCVAMCGDCGLFPIAATSTGISQTFRLVKEWPGASRCARAI